MVFNWIMLFLHLLFSPNSLLNYQQCHFHSHDVLMFVPPAGCRRSVGLRRSLRDQELWQLRQLHPGQVHPNPCRHHHRHQRGDVHFRPGGMLRHDPRVQSRPWLRKCVCVCEAGGIVLNCLTKCFHDSFAFLPSSLWSSCWSSRPKWLLWYLALSIKARWVTEDVLPPTADLIAYLTITWPSTFFGCPDKGRPGALNEWGVLKVWRTGHRDQSGGLPAESG